MNTQFSKIIYKPDKAQLWIEAVILYVALPLTFLTNFYKKFPLMLVLIILGVAVYIFLRKDKNFNTTTFTKVKVGKKTYKSMALVFILSAAIMTLMIYFIDSDKLFFLIKENPLLLILISVFYPLFSVIPQGLAYRALFFYRYGKLLPNDNIRILISGAVFSFGHILYKNPMVLIMTFGAGILFAWRYKKTNSLFASILEHALLGFWLFACGLGYFFVSGMVQ
ncbi:MAG: CPBP family intramembrane glutamic endopeptidase [Bacteroidota bacterium]|nr:CPBP family intramembrane glutamic endopeptidase [Bacteroidota bacterium]